MARKQDNMPARNKKNFRPTKAGAGMTRAGVAAYRRANPGSKLKTAVTGKVKPGSKAAKRRKSFCARSAGQMKKFYFSFSNLNVLGCIRNKLCICRRDRCRSHN
jgi:hypothetical protein